MAYHKLNSGTETGSEKCPLSMHQSNTVSIQKMARKTALPFQLRFAGKSCNLTHLDLSGCCLPGLKPCLFSELCGAAQLRVLQLRKSSLGVCVCECLTLGRVLYQISALFLSVCSASLHQFDLEY